MPTSTVLQHELALLVENEVPLSLVESVTEPDPQIAHRMDLVESDLLKHAQGKERLALVVGSIIRSAVDYAIDAPVLFRYSIDNLEPDEKTAIGKRIERLIRFTFHIEKGEKLDVRLAGEDVDIKTTLGKNWMFSKSSHNRIHLLVAYNENTARFRLGLAYVLEDQLNAKNRDEKRSMSSTHRSSIRWILKDEAYPPNMLAHLDPRELTAITSQRSGMKRVMELLRRVVGVAIPRHVVCSVANQDDPVRRLRKNGGARDPIWQEGFLVLSGKYTADSSIVREALGVKLAADEVMSLDVTDPRLNEKLIQMYKEEHELPQRADRTRR